MNSNLEHKWPLFPTSNEPNLRFNFHRKGDIDEGGQSRRVAAQQ